MADKFRIRKGDEVVVITGKHKGKAGKVLKVIRKDLRLVVQGVNMIKRHQKPQAGNPGGIVEKEASLHISNVCHIDPVDQKPTRVGIKILNDGRKVRVAKRSGEILEK